MDPAAEDFDAILAETQRVAKWCGAVVVVLLLLAIGTAVTVIG